MDKLEYIPGDLVTTNGVPLGTAKDVVYRVVSSDPSKTLKLDDGTVLKGVVCLENIEGAEFGDKGFLSGDCCAWVKDLVPIPLTSKFLKKNRWNRKNEYEVFSKLIYGVTSDNRKTYKIITIWLAIDNLNVWIVETGNEDIADIMYVHQLQNILFAMGLKSDMEV